VGDDSSIDQSLSWKSPEKLHWNVQHLTQAKESAGCSNPAAHWGQNDSGESIRGENSNNYFYWIKLICKEC